jgi:hypothetical protein
MNTPSEFRSETLAGDEFGVADEHLDALDTVEASVSSCQVQEETGEESNGDADREELPTMTVAARDESDIGLGHLTGIEVPLWHHLLSTFWGKSKSDILEIRLAVSTFALGDSRGFGEDRAN